MGVPVKARGFTLVEVLVALAVFALLAAAAVAILAWAGDQQAALRARMERLGELQRAHALLKADLSQAAVRRTRLPDGGIARNAFDAAPPGDLSRPLLGFVRRGRENPDAEPRASLQYVEYRVVDGRLERSARPALDGTAAAAPQVLLTGVEDVRAGFYSHGQWSDGWIGGAQALPRAVRLDLRLRDFGPVRQVFVLPEAPP
ncbi:type II secretion system protein GspJ [Pseudoxanthomonas sp. SGNA-20]|uniref:Type II secretion system protein J n=1 Tax=Pseudoxanthomonas taiwanensis TaxID=176598 RepID=A0A921NWP9_9GAMM|nr:MULTISPECIES: type II secretion system minor pseudopilin GspJ [Pseudoxanthomonas]KAF1687105.1 type II secretion system protein GspJ [Pseudoxanthomonas taiwanensis]RRN58566.1 type II secretion system protein GspJ [Pseudoxanthomonas sp. SGNA-20]